MISWIEQMVQLGFAYTVTVPDMPGTFVCLDFVNFQRWRPFHANVLINAQPQPVKYPVLLEHTRHKNDWALFAPYTDGQQSPWGPGQPSANAAYIESLIW